SIWPEELRDLAVKLSAIYAGPAGVTVGAVFAKRKVERKDFSSSQAWTAVALAVLWNLVSVSRSLSFALSGADKVADLIRYLDLVPGIGSFLVTSLLAYFFGRDPETE